MNHPG
jgi:elongation factor 1-alpha